MISIFIKILVYDSEMGKDFVNRFFLGELNKVDYYYYYYYYYYHQRIYLYNVKVSVLNVLRYVMVRLPSM